MVYVGGFLFEEGVSMLGSENICKANSVMNDLSKFSQGCYGEHDDICFLSHNSKIIGIEVHLFNERTGRSVYDIDIDAVKSSKIRAWLNKNKMAIPVIYMQVNVNGVLVTPMEIEDDFLNSPIDVTSRAELVLLKYLYSDNQSMYMSRQSNFK